MSIASTLSAHTYLVLAKPRSRAAQNQYHAQLCARYGLSSGSSAGTWRERHTRRRHSRDHCKHSLVPRRGVQVDDNTLPELNAEPITMQTIRLCSVQIGSSRARERGIRVSTSCLQDQILISNSISHSKQSFQSLSISSSLVSYFSKQQQSFISQHAFPTRHHCPLRPQWPHQCSAKPRRDSSWLRNYHYHQEVIILLDLGYHQHQEDIDHFHLGYHNQEDYFGHLHSEHRLQRFRRILHVLHCFSDQGPSHQLQYRMSKLYHLLKRHIN